MHLPPNRASVTPLADVALLLFDSLFDHGGTLDALRR
jgi:hypothetical protein